MTGYILGISIGITCIGIIIHSYFQRGKNGK